jgi:hypothetical protein
MDTILTVAFYLPESVWIFDEKVLWSWRIGNVIKLIILTIFALVPTTSASEEFLIANIELLLAASPTVIDVVVLNDIFLEFVLI